MSPGPPLAAAAPAGADAQVLEGVAALLAGCGLGRSAAVLREESRGPAARGAADAAALAAGLRQLAAGLEAEGGCGEPPAPRGGAASSDDAYGPLGKENVGPHVGGEEELWLNGLLEKLVNCAALPAEAALAELERAAAGREGPPPAPTEPSEHYRPEIPGAPLSDGTNDEYRDDGDPGYRVLHVSEVELLAELQEKYRAVLAASSPLPPPAATSAAGGEGVPAPAGAGSPCGPGSPGGPSATGLEGAADAGGGLAATAAAALGGAGGGGEAAGATLAPAAAAPEPATASSSAAQAAAAEAAMWAAQGRPANAGAAQQAGTAQAAAPASWQSALPHALASSRKARSGARRPTYRYAPSGDPFYPAECDGVIYDSFPLRVVYERDRTGFEESKEFPIHMNSIIAARYQVLNYLGSAAFSRAVQCLDLQTGEMVCMKIIKNDKDFIDQSLDEIKLLKIINANTSNVDEMHCLRIIDYIYHKEHLIIITELLRDNLYEFSKFNRERGQEPYFTQGHLQRITKQLLVALRYIHGLWLIHADLKPENVLIKSYSRCEVKLIDFGSSCFVDDRLSSYVQSRSYRAPEVILGLSYGQKVDIWSLGCVLAELWTGYVLFQNDSVQSLLARVIGIIGPVPRHMMASGRFVPQYFTQDGRLFREVPVPPADAAAPLELQPRIQLLLPKRSSLRQRMRTDDEEFLDFLACLLRIDPAERLTAAEALEHKWLAPGRYSDGL